MAAAAALPEGFEAMGHKIPEHRREAAYQAIKEMAPEASNSERWSLVERVADLLERDQPYKALREATNAPITRPTSSPEPSHQPIGGLFLDNTGGLRLLSHLLTGDDPNEREND